MHLLCIRMVPFMPSECLAIRCHFEVGISGHELLMLLHGVIGLSVWGLEVLLAILQIWGSNLMLCIRQKSMVVLVKSLQCFEIILPHVGLIVLRARISRWGHVMLELYGRKLRAMHDSIGAVEVLRVRLYLFASKVARIKLPWPIILIPLELVTLVVLALLLLVLRWFREFASGCEKLLALVHLIARIQRRSLRW